MSNDIPNKGLMNKFLRIIERAGNALPHPATLFAIMAIGVLILSWVASFFDIQAVHPGTQEVVVPINLMTQEGLHRILMEMVHNFTSFAPLGTVLVAMLGIGVAEGSGLIGAALRLLVINSPTRLLTSVLVFAGVMSNMASDIGYVLLIPLGAMIFHAAGKHPIAGLAATFAGVSGGFSANLLLGTVDPLLQGLSEESARLIDPTYEVAVTCNYYFMIASTFLITAAGTWVTERIVIPNLGPYEGDVPREEIKPLTAEENKGIKWSLVTAGILALIIGIGVVPEDGFLRNLDDGSWERSPLLKGIVAFLLLGSTLIGIAYGFAAGTFKNDSDVMDSMVKATKTLGIYIVLVFFAAQFVAYFKWTNLGMITAIKGADGLKYFISLVGIENKMIETLFVIIPFICLAASINMLMGSASAKWAIMGPVFIPMFMLLGYSPEFTQAAYRVGDSVTNIVSPMMSFFALIIAYFQQYDKKAGIGTLISTMVPYSVTFFFAWIVLLIIWVVFEIPLGPGSGFYYTP